MKKEEVPQDKSSLSKSNVRELCYATDKDGNYTTVLSEGWEPKTIALNNSIQDIEERIQKATNNGIKYFKYIGPPPDREFCKIYINKILPLEEIKILDNGQKLNALYYCGGYNCRHRWVPATEKEYKEQQNKL